MSFDHVRAVVFDTFGTVVDWRTSIAREGQAVADRLGVQDFDGDAFARAWRAGYQPKMEKVRTGERPFTLLDTLHRERLDEIADDFGLGALDDAARADLTDAWHRLDPWPDSVAGITRLSKRFLVGTFSNGSMVLLSNMAKNAGIPWDVILCSDVFKAYKPDPATYLGAAEILGWGDPSKVMLCAAHNGDLAHARSHGLMTAYVNRPTEYGPDQSEDFEATEDWDIVDDSIENIAAKMGC